MNPAPLYLMDLDLRVPFGPATLNLFYVNYEPARPGWFYPHHCHSSYELHYVPSGYGTLRVGAERYAIGPGTLYMTGPGVYHEQTADERQPMEEYCLNFEVLRAKRRVGKQEPFLAPEIDRLLAELARTNFWYGSVDSLYGALFRQLVEELREPSLGSHLLGRSIACQLVVQAIRRFADEPSGCALPRKHLKDARRTLVDNFFREPFGRPSPGALADLIGVSRRQLERILREYYGMSFTEKVTATRIELAKDMLERGALSVRDVAEAAGFTSLEYFSRVFRGQVGLPPGAYRETRRETASRQGASGVVK